MMRSKMVFLVAFGLGCNDLDEWNCEVEVEGVTVCVEGDSGRYCEKEWGGAATRSEVEPGGPYRYCDDLYAVECPGSLVEKGDGFTAWHTYWADTDEDCAVADGARLGG